MIIRETIYALTGYDGINESIEISKTEGGCRIQLPKTRPEVQKDLWSRKCLWVEAVMAGYVHSVSSKFSFPGTVMNMALGVWIMELTRDLQKETRLDRQFQSIVDGAHIGGLLLAEELGGHVQGAAIGAGCGALSKVAFTIASFVRDHAEYLDA